MRKRVLFLLAVAAPLLLPSSIWSSSPKVRAPRLVLTSVMDGLQPEESFTCNGLIHGYITLPAPVTGEHRLEGIWKMPNGTVNQHSKISIEFPPPGRQTAYIWLHFEEESGGLMGELGPSSERQKANQIYGGEWQVEVRWDEKTLVTSPFKVKC